MLTLQNNTSNRAKLKGQFGKYCGHTKFYSLKTNEIETSIYRALTATHVPHDLSSFLGESVAMATEEKLLCHGRMVMSTLVDHTPTHISVHFTFAAPQCAPPVHFLTVTAGAYLRVPARLADKNSFQPKTPVRRCTIWQLLQSYRPQFRGALF